MARASWNGTTIAESDDTVVVEGNHYFPLEAVKREHLRASEKHTTCPWKGEASYLSLESMVRRIRTPPGTTPSRSPPPPTSRIASPSGVASRSKQASEAG